MTHIKRLYLNIFLLISLYMEMTAAQSKSTDDNYDIRLQDPILLRMIRSSDRARLRFNKDQSSDDDYEYPIIVPKRGAMFLDRVIVALQKALGEENMKGYYPQSTSNLQRRGQDKGTVYWRCYFNVVTCF